MGIGARSSIAVLALTAPLVAPPAQAEDTPASPETVDSVKVTARDVVRDTSTRARADLPARLADPDTADGRVEGDVGIVIGLGVTVAEEPRAASELRLRYLDMAGIFVTYEDGFGAASADPARVLTAGIEMRPLFLGRWVTGNEVGIRWTDLIIDSLGLELGGCFEQPRLGSFGSRPGLQASLGLELPILGIVNGPWIDIHGGARWSDAVLEGGPIDGPADRGLFISFTLAYHRIFATHLVDVGDLAP